MTYLMPRIRVLLPHPIKRPDEATERRKRIVGTRASHQALRVKRALRTLEGNMQTAEIITDLSHYEQQAKPFQTITESNLDAALLMVRTMKRSAKELDETRTAMNEPHNKSIKEANAKYNPAIEFCKKIASAIDQRVVSYRMEQERIALEAQQREIERAAQEKAEAEALAQMAQDEANKQLDEGNITAAASLHSEAETLQIQAALSVPRVVPQEPKTYRVAGGGSVNYRQVKDWVIPGLSKETKVSAMSPAFAACDFNLIRQFFVLDPVAVNAALKANGELPKPFVVTTKHVSTVR